MAHPDTLSIPNQRLKSDLALLSVSLIWGSAFVAQRIAAVNVNVFLFNGARFLVGAAMLLPFAWSGLRGLSLSNRAATGLAGLLLFAAAGFQQLGLETTTAGNAGFITGLYVVFIPIILAIGWRHRPRRAIWLAVSFSAAGLFLLSTGGRLHLAPGDALELAGAVLWALHVILVGRLAGRMGMFQLAFGQYLVCGLFNGAIALWLGGEGISAGLAGGWWAILYTGVFSIGVGYTLQIYGQKEAPPSDAAILLSMEAVFAALFGWLILTESLTAVQLAGCSLMAAGMILAQLQTK